LFKIKNRIKFIIGLIFSTGAIIIEVAYIIEAENFQSLLNFKKLVPVILLIGAIPMVINNIKKVDK
jgi:hypothetical protein